MADKKKSSEKLLKMNKKSEVIRKVPAKMAIRDIANLKGITKTSAVLEYVNQQRNRPRLDHKDEKTNTPAGEMPWAPEPRQWMKFPPGLSSILSISDHRRYVAIISNFLRPKPNFRFEMNRIELEGLDEKLRPEREIFEKLALKHIQSLKNTTFNMSMRGAFALFVQRQREKISAAFSELNFCEELARVAWPQNADDDLVTGLYHLKCVEMLAEGRQRRVRFPNVRRRCQYFMNEYVVGNFLQSESNNKINLFDDTKAINLALENNLEYVMDASTLRQLLVDKWAFRNQSFCYRLSVIRRVRNGMAHRVCLFSKPLLISHIDQFHLHRQFMKWVVKTEINRSTTERQRADDTETKAETSSSTSTNQFNPHLSASTQPLSNGSAITKETSSIDNETFENNIEMNEDDLLGSILGSMDSCPSTLGSVNTNKNKASTKVVHAKSFAESNLFMPTITAGIPDIDNDLLASNDFFKDLMKSTTQSQQTNSQSGTNLATSYRYELISLKPNAKHLLLVRTTNHGVDQEGIPISITIKNEYVPEVGSQSKCDEERLWNCVTGTLKGATEHVNLHMFPRNGHCIQMQRFEPIRHYSEMNMPLKKKLFTRIRRVYDLLETLEKLEIGEYLIVQNGESLKILAETHLSAEPADINDQASTIYNASTAIMSCCFESDPQIIANSTSIWTGVDAHLPLVWHIVQGRIPGALIPPNQNWHNKRAKQETTVSNNNLNDCESTNSKMSKSQKRRMRKKNLKPT